MIKTEQSKKISRKFEYKVEDRGTFKIKDMVFPDFRVVLYIDGEYENEWDGAWSKRKATVKANLWNEQQRIHEEIVYRVKK